MSLRFDDLALPEPTRTFWRGLAAAAVLLIVATSIASGSILLGIATAAFAVLVGAIAWPAYHLIGSTRIDGRPVVAAAVVSLLGLVYAVLVAGTILLGLIAGTFVMLAGIAVGVVHGLSA